MWKLTSKTGEVHYLLPEKEKHVVGRSNADLNLKNDTSISRTHAYLFPTDNHVKLVDIGSKYGTFYNENIDHKISMDKNVPVELKNGERVCFGVLQNEWILSNMKLVTLTSTLNTDEKIQLKEILKSLNGEIIESFAPNCTHLTMRGITVTPKLLYALVERIPIVNCQYWRDYVIQLRIGNVPPNPENYMPEIAEDFLKFSKHLLKPNEGRKTLFAGKTFVFIGKKHYDTYISIIPQAGGKIKNLNQGVQKSFLTQKNVIVIQYIPTTESQSSQTIDNIAEYLKSKSLRMVPDYEIGLALVNCSIEKYCNPKFNHILDMCNPPKNTDNCLFETIAIETPVNPQTITSEKAGCVEIPESNVYEPQNEYEKTDACSANKIQLIGNTIEINDDSEINIEMRDFDLEPPVKKHVSCNLQNENVNSPHFVIPVEKNISDNLHIDDVNSLPKPPVLNNQKENKRKRININEDNENIKRMCPDKTKEILKSRNEEIKVNLGGFLNSSQITKAIPKEVDSVNFDKTAENENSNDKKRGRFALITSDDDDDDDLFDFGKSLKKSKPDDNRDSSSNFDNVIKQSNNQVQRSNTIISNDQTTPVLNTTRIKRVIKLPEPIQEVVKKIIKITPGEWLSKSLIKLDIKNEDKNVAADATDNNVNDSLQSNWIDSIRGGFEVRSKEMNLIVQTRGNISMEEDSVSSASLETHKIKNFKTFVKKRNFIPQKEIVTTVPFQIHGFSF